MADILIKGMEMKDYPQSITINPDGSVVKDTFGLHRTVEEWKAIQLPEHGDLIDRGKLTNGIYYDMDELNYAIDRAPVIMEASK